jgi:hypothetical protein
VSSTQSRPKIEKEIKENVSVRYPILFHIADTDRHYVLCTNSVSQQYVKDNLMAYACIQLSIPYFLSAALYPHTYAGPISY